MEKFWLNYVMAYCKRQIATVERHERKASDIFSFRFVTMFLFNDNLRLSFQEPNWLAEKGNAATSTDMERPVLKER